jgi:hypothetical protein
MSNFRPFAVSLGNGQVVDQGAAQRQQQLVQEQRNQCFERTLSKGRTAATALGKAATSLVYAVLDVVLDAHKTWSKPSGFQVPVDCGSAPRMQDVEQYLQEHMVTYNKTKISAAEFLSKPGVTAFQALQICYRHAMFGDMTAKSVEETLSRAAGRVSVIIALRLHLLRGGAAETLHNQLAAAAGSAEIPAAWLDELLPLVQHDQGSVWRSCKPPRGGHVSTRQFALNLAQQRPVCGALPTVSKVVGVFGAGPSRRTADGIWQAIQSVCSQDPALRRLLQQLQQVRRTWERQRSFAVAAGREWLCCSIIPPCPCIMPSYLFPAGHGFSSAPCACRQGARNSRSQHRQARQQSWQRSWQQSRNSWQSSRQHSNSGQRLQKLRDSGQRLLKLRHNMR